MASGGGLKAIAYSIKVVRQVGITRAYRAITAKSTCKTCALGMGGQRGPMRNEVGHFPEICKKSLQAQLTDIQPAIDAAIFDKYPVAEFAAMTGHELEKLGRLNNPLYKEAGKRHYRAISWQQAFEKTVVAMKATRPQRSFFYSSGRSSNEAAFLLQLFARLYGTNNINNCSYYCHQASGVALNSMIGSGTATVQLKDLAGADLVFVIGANPASNHPRFMRELMHCRRRGGQVIVINPVREPGLVKFAVPSSFTSMLKGGDKIASHFLQPNIGGDIALLKAISLLVLEQQAEEHQFIQDHTSGFASFEKSLQGAGLVELAALSGVSLDAIKQVADLYINSKNTIFTWAMGVTHHLHGVENIQAITNLALLRGMLGRPGAGLLPLRGHSNVQGVGSVGVTPALKEQVLKDMQKYLRVRLPRKAGLDTMGCMQAAHRGQVDFAFLLGGNLYGSNPDSQFAAEALDRVGFKVFLNTTLNAGHFHGVAGETLVLPVLARDEEVQKTTQESMFNFVRLSDGGISRLSNCRGEVDVIATIGEKLNLKNGFDFSAFKIHKNIRQAIARSIPGYARIAGFDQGGDEFQIKGRTFHQPRFNTASGRAAFKAVKTPSPSTAGWLRLMTVRSEGQFNTIIYDNHDVYRGQSQRYVVLLNEKDIQELGLKVDQVVDVVSQAGSVRGIRVRAFQIRQGNALMYFPEANPLVSRQVDKKSKTPAFKSTLVKIIAQ